MSLRLTDPIIAPNRLTANMQAAILAREDQPDAKDRNFYVSLGKWAGVAGIDGAVTAGQHLVETANQQSPRWNNDLNPGGVGIPADSTVQPFKIASEDEAARIMVQCVYMSTTKGKAHPDVPIPAAAQDWFNRVWIPKCQDRNFPTVRTLDDLDVRYVDADTGEWHATWAWDGTDDGDPAYAEKVVSRGNTYMPGLPATGGTEPEVPTSGTPVFGRVIHPAFQDRPITKPEGNGQNNLGKREVWGITLHRMIGSLWGTDGYFRLTDVGALTDYGIGTMYQDGAENDGLILKWNNPLGYQSGWASGPVSAPYGDAAKFVAKYGKDAVNKYRASVEVSGLYYTSPITLKVKQSIAGIIAYWADQDEIPWDVFPIRPKDGLNFVLHHQGFTIGTGKVCSGDVVMDATPEMIEMAREIMRFAQIGTVTPVPSTKPTWVAPHVYPWMKEGNPGFGEDHWVGTSEWIYLPQVMEVVQEAERFTNGAKGSPRSGDNIRVGTKFMSYWIARSTDNNRSYRTTKSGNRVLCERLSPYDAVTANGTVTRYTTKEAKGKGEKGTIVRKRPKGKPATKQAA
jgi:hypothetical protein